MRSAQGHGPTFEEAVDAALLELGESRRNVDVKVLSETPHETVVQVSIIGSGDSPKSGPGPSDRATVARDRVAELLKKMGVNAQVSVREGQDPIILDVSGRDLGLLIGWRGETLRALQAITNLLVSRETQTDPQRVIVDVERYRQRREHTVREIAYRAARQVKVTGDPITLDAMQPFERR